MTPTALKALQAIVGAGRVKTGQEELLVHSYDGTAMLSAMPEAVVVPENAAQIAAILTLANAEGFPVVPRGSGTGLSGGAIPLHGGVVLALAAFNQVIEIDRDNLTATVQPGVITGKLQAAVEKLGLFYPPDPGSREICTLGGNAAEDAGGLHGLKYGTTKDYVMGLEAVLPQGHLVRSGGKAIKDVAGYNLRQLLVGSEGTLGIFTQLTLKLLPKPPAKKVFWAMFPAIEEAAQAAANIVAKPVLPFMLEFLDRVTLDCVESFSRLGLPSDGGAMLLVGLDGHPQVVEEDLAACLEVCRQAGALQFRVAESAAEMSGVMAARRSAFAALARVRPTTILEDATVPRSRLAEMVRFIADQAEKNSLMIGTFGHAGDGNLHPTFLTDEKDTAEVEKIHHVFDLVFAKAVALGGTITGEHGVGIAKRAFLPQQLGQDSVDFMRQLKGMLDPQGILNPGKVFQAGIRCEGKLS